MLLFFISLIVLMLAASFTVATQNAGKRLIPIGILALIAGVLFEGRRVSQKWSTVLLITLASLVVSMLAFLPGRGERDYQITDHIEVWPYFFIIIFALISVCTHGNKVVPRLTEGITLLQSIAVIYWVIDHGDINTDNYLVIGLMGIGIMLSLYSAFHAFTYTTLSQGGRLTLSLWSSTIMMLFAIDNVYRVYHNEQIESTADVSQAAYITLQFFLLGISAIYIIQNFLMLMGFLPGKGTFFNAQYFRDVRELKKDHINRYSERQISIGHSFICVALASTTFVLNYNYQIFPIHVAIWLMFLLFPVFMSFIASTAGRTGHGYEARR